jgi:hypothetical protein
VEARQQRNACTDSRVFGYVRLGRSQYKVYCEIKIREVVHLRLKSRQIQKLQRAIHASTQSSVVSIPNAERQVYNEDTVT